MPLGTVQQTPVVAVAEHGIYTVYMRLCRPLIENDDSISYSTCSFIFFFFAFLNFFFLIFFKEPG